MSGTQVRVRRAGTDAVAKIVEVSSALFREDAGRRDPFVNLSWPEEEGLGYFASLVRGAGGLFLLAEFAGRTVG